MSSVPAQTVARPGAGCVLLSVEDISLSFGAVQALINVSFDIREGEIRAIIGPHGARKQAILHRAHRSSHPPHPGCAVFCWRND